MSSRCSTTSNNIINVLAKLRTSCQRLFFSVKQNGEIGHSEYPFTRTSSLLFEFLAETLFVLYNMEVPPIGVIQCMPKYPWLIGGVEKRTHGDDITGLQLGLM